MKRIGAAVLATVVVAASLFGGQMLASPAPVANASATNVVFLTPSACIASLIGPLGGLANAAARCGIINGAAGFDVNALAKDIGDKDGIPEYSDFAGDLDGNQLQEPDGFAWVIAFVDARTPVQFSVPGGGGTLTTDSPSLAANPTPPNFVCGGLTSDQDCGGSVAAPANGVVVVGLCGGPAPATNGLGVTGCAGAPAATRGSYTLTVVQDRVPVDVPYTVVGTPRTIKFQVFEPTVSTGVDAAAGGCPLATDVAGFTTALGRPEKTVVFARVADIDGTNIASAWVNWSTADTKIGTFATGLTPTLDLGSFGFGAPNVFCGTTRAGIVPMTIKVQIGPDAANAPWFPSAVLASATQDETVLGPPSTIALTSTPAQIACDGTATAEVAATVTNAAGENVADGTAVKFQIQVLGTASPITTTTKDGIAKSVITPLSSSLGAQGAPVIVSSGVGEPVVYSVQSSIIVSCAGVAGSSGGGTQGTGGTAGTTGSTGTITPPNTGSGGLATQQGRNTFAWWPAFGLALGAMVVAGASLRRRRR